MILFLSELPSRSKIGGFDKTVLLDSTRLAWLAPGLKTLADRDDGSERLWGYDYSVFCKLLTDIGKSLGVPLLPYAMRHSGVIIDRVAGVRTQAES